MPATIHTIVLSPHLDDAVLSCGGLLYDLACNGDRALVVTVFAADPRPGPVTPLAADLRRRSGLGLDAEERRRDEDRRALARIGVEPLHLRFQDAIYRRATTPDERPLYPRIEALFQKVSPEDAVLAAELVGALRALPPAGRVLAPLAVGRHVDHVLVRQAAEQAFPHDRLHYEDFPYCRKRFALRQALGWWGRGWQAVRIPLSEPAVTARIEAIHCYGSQLAPLFGQPAHINDAIRNHVGRVGGERLWRRLAPFDTHHEAAR